MDTKIIIECPSQIFAKAYIEDVKELFRDKAPACDVNIYIEMGATND